MKEFITVSIVSLLFLGCNVAEPQYAQSQINNIEIPIVLVYDDTLDNQEQKYKAIENRLYKNSIFEECELLSEDRKNDVCIKINARAFEYKKSIVVTYFSGDKSVSADFPAYELQTSESRTAKVVITENETDVNELLKEKGFSAIQGKLIKKDIINLHDKDTPYRQLRASR